MLVTVVTRISPGSRLVPSSTERSTRTTPSTIPAAPGNPLTSPAAGGGAAVASKTSERRPGSAAHANGSNVPRISDGYGGSAA
jgi:hypothetical protein